MLHFPWAASSVWIAVLALVKSNMLIFHLFKKVPRGGCNCIRTLLLWLVLSFMVQRLSEHKELFLLKLQDTNSIL